MGSVHNNKLLTILTAPSLNDSYCISINGSELHVDTGSIAKASVIFIISTSIVLANILFIAIMNCQNYRRNSKQETQFRYLLICLSTNDLTIGLLVTPVAIFPALFQCWPFGEILCQVQALLRCTLCRQSSMILSCIAIDRYFSIFHRKLYKNFCNNKICLMTICVSLVLLISLFVCLIISDQGFYYNNFGLYACEIFYRRSSFRIFSACLFYFPTTLLFMYCYGSIYHFTYMKSSLRNMRRFNIRSMKMPSDWETREKENKLACRMMGAISFIFLVTYTPWFICEIILGSTDYKPSPTLQFIFTWAAFSNSFWSPVLYWLLDEEFRTSCRIVFLSKENVNEFIGTKSTLLQDVTIKYETCSDTVCQINSNCPTPPPPPKMNGIFQPVMRY